MKEKEANAPKADADSTLIADLNRALESFALRRKQPGEGIMIEARQLTQKWKVKECSENPSRPLFDATSSTTTLLLAGMVVALRKDHQLLEQIRRHFRNSSQILKQSWEKFLADALETYLPRVPNLTPKQQHERKRRREQFRIIEWEYGGANELAAAEWKEKCKKFNDPSRRAAFEKVISELADPKCLDDIFKGGHVNMLTLQELFGIERHKFPKKLPSIRIGRQIFYDYRAIVMIMDALLSEQVRKKRKRLGRRPRMPWLVRPSLRARVLSGIEARIRSLSLPQHIKIAFMTVVSRHLPDSGKKDDCKEM